MVEIKCTGENYSDCLNCNRYFSSHSLTYVPHEGKEVSTITCSTGGHRIFNEDGEWVNRNKQS